MTLSIQLLEEELKKALKAKEEIKTGTLRMLLSALHNAAKDKKYRTSIGPEQGRREQEDLSSEEIESIVASEAKKRRESIEAFSAYGGSASGGEKEKIDRAIEKEKAELDILLSFLPPQLSEQEIDVLVQEAVASTGATTQKEMGKVMGYLAPKVKGRADGSLVSKRVKNLLSSS